MNKLSRILAVAVMAVGSAAFATDGGGIKGWSLAGSKPKAYTASVDAANARGSHRTVLYQSVEEVKDGFGTMMQMVRADKYKSLFKVSLS